MWEEFELEAEVWLYPGKAGWHFVSIPLDRTEEIRAKWGPVGAAFGSLPVVASIGSTAWTTSLFFDSKAQRYQLPLKAAIRKAQGIEEGNVVRVRLRMQQ